ncbi:MAG: insulinase family protein [Muribaculaceae bacterium]|jgi:zinc protease|nr:insulinase family protein [Muribaculaceae bacterium]
MNIKYIFTVVFLLIAGAISAQQMPSVPQDKDVRVGKLANGLTYYLRHNAYPEHKADFYIAQRVGSINEDENQRGLAHFLEHMAFNGSDHFKDNNLLEWLRSIGVKFGENLNAETNYDHTVYYFTDVPTTRTSALDSCVLILKDWSNGLTLSTKEIDNERDVIHNEYRLSIQGAAKVLERQLPEVLKGSKYGMRSPIGLMSVVDNFKPEALRSYYKKWYRPDNQAIIIVGDIDVDHIEAQIKQLFSGIKVPANAAKVVDEPVPDNNTAIYLADKDKELPSECIFFNKKHEAMPDSLKSTMIYFIYDFMNDVLSNMLNSRLQEVVQQPGSPMNMAMSYYGPLMGITKTEDALGVDAYPKEGKENEAIAALAREVKRVHDFGFTATEYARAKDAYLSDLEKDYTNRDKTENKDYCQKYVANFLTHDPIPSIETKYQMMKMILPSIPFAQVNQYAQALFEISDTNLVVLAMQPEKDGMTYLTPASMKAAVDGVRAEKLTAYVDNVKQEPLIATMPAKGSIVKETENAKLGFKELTLSNGAKVLLKKTDFKNDEIAFSAFAKGGKDMFTKADATNLMAFSEAIENSGLGDFSNTELQKALAGKQVSVSPEVDNKSRLLNGASTPKDLETLMQLIYLSFTNVNKDEKAVAAYMGQYQAFFDNKPTNADLVFTDSLHSTIYCGNKFYRLPDGSDVKTISYDRQLQIMKQLFSNASDFTFSFVGNFDEATIRPLIEQYIASLPSVKQNLKQSEIRTIFKGDRKNAFTLKMENPQSKTAEVWRSNAIPNTLQNRVTAEATAQVLTMLYLRTIREQASAAYTVGSMSRMEEGGKDCYAMIYAMCPTNPDKAKLANDLLYKGINDAAKSVDAADVAKAKEAMLKQNDIDARTNSYWNDVFFRYYINGVDTNTGYKDAVSAITPAGISSFLQNVILKSGNHVEVIMTPQAK